jgi:hypothetical protein
VGIELGMISGGLRFNFGLSNIGRDADVLGVNYSFPGGRNQFAQFYVGLSIWQFTTGTVIEFL